MANKSAFTQLIGPDDSGLDENELVHQSSPAWVLTFVRWSVRDTLRTDTDNNLAVAAPLVVESDCIDISVTGNKGTLTPSMSATLVMSDINYETAVAPGDFVFVNMLNWESDARRVANQARANQPINGEDDGFKGFFKVQSVRRVLSSDPETGVRTVNFNITAFAFTEFNNTIYFNPYMIQNAEKNNLLLFASYIGQDWQLIASDKGLTNVQDLIKALIESFIGTGVSGDGQLNRTGAVRAPNTHFFVPKIVGQLLNVKSATAAKDLFIYLFGIQQYSSGATQTLAAGMNPTSLTVKNGRFFYSQQKCQGETVSKPEYWNQVQTWSILKQFANSPINELFTTFRISPNGSIMPTVVFRQIPFTTEDFQSGSSMVTRFMSLPRWKISPAFVYSLDIGRDEAARINFVQYFGRSDINLNGVEIAEGIAQHNYVYDVDDVQRSGLRPYIVTSQFDTPQVGNSNSASTLFNSPKWAKIVGDSLIGGHLKLNGTIESVGIQDPIAVGDNLEFNGTVFHIEQIMHRANISSNGIKTFRTYISLSSGMSVQSSAAQGTKYSEMRYGNAYDLRNADYKNNQILPGISDSQDVVSRPGNPDLIIKSTGTGFVQPNTNTSITSDGESDNIS